MRKKRSVDWTVADREILEKALAEGYTVPWIAKSLNKSAPAIYSELERCLDPEEYMQRRFVKYTAKRAIEKDIMRLKGELDDGYAVRFYRKQE